jgi:hypothetical protein
MADYVEKEDHEGGEDDNEPVPVSNFARNSYKPLVMNFVFLQCRKKNQPQLSPQSSD